MQITNYTGISLPLAVWLASDGYDFSPGQARAISATALMKPVRQILLRERLTETTAEAPDLSDLIASRLGHTIHDGIEKAWTTDYRGAMRKLGYPENLIQRIAVNPVELKEGMFPVYIEQRFEKEFLGYRISGKFDMILEGTVHDFKSTSTYATKGGKDEDYRIQGSIYRWLNPEKVTEDHMIIHFIFTDWQKALARANPDYPQSRLMDHRVELLSLTETEAWIKAKLRALEAAADLPEAELPYCNDKELWRGETVWKYYSDPSKANQPGARATKNCASAAEAAAYKASKGGKGIIVEKPGQVKACSYCAAFPICSQKDLYDHG
jgi:hypothetical protein